MYKYIHKKSNNKIVIAITKVDIIAKLGGNL